MPPPIPTIPTPPSLPSLPAACADCVETVQFSGIAQIQENLTKRYRALDGKTRLDLGSFSIITDPISQVRITLDHLKMEALIIQPPALPSAPGVQLPGMSLALPPLPTDGPGVDIVQLGKSIVHGMEAEGFRYVFAIADPLSPPPIASWEVWIHLATQLPVLTQAIGPFGQRTTICQCLAVEPPANLFQIPPNYRTIIPEIPKLPADLPAAALPSVPSAPSLPQAPSLPSVPTAPSLPSAASLPSAPSLPSLPSMAPPSLPRVPSLPSAPSLPQAPTLPSAPAAPNLPKLPKF